MFSYKLFCDFISNHLYMEHISLNLMWNWSTSRQTVKVVFVRYNESGDSALKSFSCEIYVWTTQGEI